MFARLRQTDVVTRSLAAILACAMLAIVAGCAGVDRRPAPTLEEIVQMSADGVSDDEIVLRLKESRAVYQLTASQIVDLSSKGVSETVLDTMQQDYINAVRRRERLMYGDPFWGYPCIGCRYPYWRVPPYYFPY